MSHARRTAIVTGSSSGIGKAIAIRLLRSSYNVVLNYSADRERAERTLAECRQIVEHVLLVKADVSKASEAANLVKQAVAEFGTLDVLVNNAARVADRPALDMTEEDWDLVVDVNMKGAFLCSQHAAPHGESRQRWRDTEHRRVHWHQGTAERFNTCASKAGLMIMTQCLALELSPKVRVNHNSRSYGNKRDGTPVRSRQR